MKAFFEGLGEIGIFIAEILRTYRKTCGNGKAILEQTAQVSSRTLATVLVAGVFVGAILVLQFQLMLMPYEAISLLGGMNTSAMIREVGPLLISFLIAGKIGAYTTAELGTMRVTEQIDAIECLGHNPIRFLILPRFFGIIFSSMILLALGLLISIVGSIVVAEVISGVNYREFLRSIPDFTDLWTVFSGFFKCFLYSVIVAAVSTHRGFYARGGARGVGEAVTSSAVATNLYIILANFFGGMFLNRLYECYHFLHRILS